jgi:hypothetical protein
MAVTIDDLVSSGAIRFFRLSLESGNINDFPELTSADPSQTRDEIVEALRLLRSRLITNR